MKRVVQVLVCTAGIAVGALSGLGCGMNDMSLAKEGTVPIDMVAAGKVHVVWSDAHQDEDGFVVTGVVRRSDTVGMPIPVNVQASIISSDGMVLDEAQSGDIRVPRRITSRTQGFERFTIRFADVPPEGASVRVIARSS